MANQITDKRTLLDTLDTVTNTDDLTGAAAGTQDTEIFIQGTASVGQYITNTIDGILYDAGSAQNWSGNTFYVWINCGIVGLLDTKANGGMRIRFAGNTVTDWFEVYVGGQDEYPPAIQGGWVQFVVNIETARETAIASGWTNGTVPATSAIRYVGYAAITAGSMPRMVDNTWVDEIRRLPANTAGIVVEGRNGGTTDWNSQDITTELGTPTGTFVPSTGGSYKINTPIQFGTGDTTTHGFTDSNTIWLWDSQEYLPDDFYRISAVGASGGTTNLTFGEKSGTGNDASGSQGITIASATDGARWNLDFNDPNLDSINFYGSTFINGNILELNNSAIEVISTLYINGTQALVTDSLQLRNTVTNANTTGGTAFFLTDGVDKIRNCSFQFSDGHAIEIQSGGTYTFTGNIFVGGFSGATGDNLTPNSGSLDAMIFNDSGGLVTLNIAGGGDTPSVRNSAGSTTEVNNNVSVTITGLKDNTEVRVYDSATSNPQTELAGVENATDGTTDDRSFTFSLSAGQSVDIVYWNKEFEQIPPRTNGFIIPSTDTEFSIVQLEDPNYNGSG